MNRQEEVAREALHIRAEEYEKRRFQQRMREKANGPDAEPPPEAKPDSSFTLFDDLETAPRKKWLVHDFIGEGEINCTFGPPSSGKSCIVGDRGAHIAAGRVWFGRRVECCAVLHVAAERAAVVKRRYAAFGKHHGISSLPLAVVSRRVDLCSNYNDAKLIVEYCKRLEDAKQLRCGLVIIETVNRVLAGGDENSPKDMGALVDRFAFIQAEMGVRGHGALLGACDVTNRIEKIGNVRACTVDKANDGPEGERVVFDLISVDLHYDEETGIVTTAPVVVPTDVAAFATATERPVPLANSVKIARDCLIDVLAREGKVPPRNAHIPPDTPTASEVSWRANCYARGISKGATPRAGQMAFASAAQSLQAKGLIGRWEGECWLINKN